MNFNEYQKEARKTAIYPQIGHNLVYPVLGLTGESGEVAENVKKLIRDKDSIKDDEFVSEITKELGDVLWYVAAICSELGLPMQVVAKLNLAKLSNRMKHENLSGSGDNR